MTSPPLPSPRRSRLRRWGIGVVIAACVLVAAGRWLVPELVGYALRRELAARGFPGARLRVVSVGLWHVALRDVRLADGLALGEVELDAGLSLLWGGRAELLAIRHATIDASALARFTQHGERRGQPPVARIRIDASVLEVAGTRVPFAATLALAPGARVVEVVTPGFDVGEARLRDVRLTAHERADRTIAACGNARLEARSISACTTLPSPARPPALEVTWVAHELARTPWIVHGRGRIARSPGGGVVLEAGHVEASLPVRSIGAITLRGARLSAAVAGRLGGGLGSSLDQLDLAIDGDVRADRAALAGVARLAGVDAAVKLQATVRRGSLRVAPTRPIALHARTAELDLAGRKLEARAATLAIAKGVDLAAPTMPAVLPWTAARIRWGESRFTGVAGTVRARPRDARGRKRREIAWRATRVHWRDAELATASGRIFLGGHDHARWSAARGTWHGAELRGPHGTVAFTGGGCDLQVAWRGIAGPGPLVVGAGTVDLRAVEHEVRIERGVVQALGGTLSIDPAVRDARGALDLVLRARGLQLARILAAVGRGRVEGSGAVDGELALRIADGWSLRHATLRARGPGIVRVRDRGLRDQLVRARDGFEVHKRIAGALVDFRFTRLAIELAPAGASPELRVTTRGRGRRVPQELDLVLNLRGVRDTARRIATRVDPRSPVP